MTTTPSARSDTSMRQRDVAVAAPSASATAAIGIPTDSATAAAASALLTWCAPTRRSCTGARRAGRVQREAGAAEVVELHVGGADVGVRGRAEFDDVRVRARGHRRDQVVVGVEHGDPVGGQRLDQLALGLRDRLAAAELAEVRRADVEDDADLRRGDLGEVPDVADPAGAEFEHEEHRRRVGAQHGVGMAEFVVGRPDRRDRRAGGRRARSPAGPSSRSCRTNR